MEIHQKKAGLDGWGDGVPKGGQEQAAADSRGSRTCVCANTLSWGCHAQGRKDILPWYRPVGVAKTSGETHKEEEPGCPKRVSGRQVVRR